jgi:hypothetical protein
MKFALVKAYTFAKIKILFENLKKIGTESVVETVPNFVST